MEKFSELLEKLYFTSSNLAKTRILIEYLRKTPDPDRGYAIAAIAGELKFDLFKRSLIKDLVIENTDEYLFKYSYDYVGELSETVALIWNKNPEENFEAENFSLTDIIQKFENSKKSEVRKLLFNLLGYYNPQQRWALIKLGTRGLRIGISARFLKKILAQFGGKDIQEIEEVWHGLEPPYENFFAWLEGKSEKPIVKEKINFIPTMLAHPIEDKELENITPKNYQAEWKFDGIRVQIHCNQIGKSIFTRTGEDISHSFPDIIERLNFNAVLDGELVVKKDNQIRSFNDLQQRLNKKKPSQKLISQYPAHLIIYDVLFHKGEDLRKLKLTERFENLNNFGSENKSDYLSISEKLSFENINQLKNLRDKAASRDFDFIEGLMLKHTDSEYVSGRPKGKWYKWKRDPLTIDAIMMYAQRGHGKRSSYYSDYTFGLWYDENIKEVLPIGKAYSGFTDEELKKLDKFVRNNTTNRFGPVREVKKELVVELAFDSVHESNRHKSGLALRFPRIKAIRWDKPKNEADILENLRKLVI